MRVPPLETTLNLCLQLVIAVTVMFLMFALFGWLLESYGIFTNVSALYGYIFIGSILCGGVIVYTSCVVSLELPPRHYEIEEIVKPEKTKVKKEEDSSDLGSEE